MLSEKQKVLACLAAFIYLDDAPARIGCIACADASRPNRHHRPSCICSAPVMDETEREGKDYAA